jgi:hypothetical protein
MGQYFDVYVQNDGNTASEVKGNNLFWEKLDFTKILTVLKEMKPLKWTTADEDEVTMFKKL